LSSGFLVEDQQILLLSVFPACGGYEVILKYLYIFDMSQNSNKN